MSDDETIDRLIRAGYYIGAASLGDLKAAAEHARRSAARMDIDTADDDHLAADMSVYTSLMQAGDTLDLLVVYRQAQSWAQHTDRPIDLDTNDNDGADNGDHR